MKKAIAFILPVVFLLAMTACSDGIGSEKPSGTTAPSPENTVAVSPASSTADSPSNLVQEGLPALTLIGHASFKIKTAEGTVIYVDPNYDGDYSEPADIILVSHEHPDHNKIDLCTQNEGCLVLRVTETINADNTYNIFDKDGVNIEPVAAYNNNHPKSSTNGFVLTFDGIKVYLAADTSKIDEMQLLKDKSIDYAFFPIDGQYNMDAAEAMECAQIVGAKHNTPIHINNANAADFKPENLLSVAYGETIELKSE